MGGGAEPKVDREAGMKINEISVHVCCGSITHTCSVTFPGKLLHIVPLNSKIFSLVPLRNPTGPDCQLIRENPDQFPDCTGRTSMSLH